MSPQKGGRETKAEERGRRSREKTHSWQRTPRNSSGLLTTQGATAWSGPKPGTAVVKEDRENKRSQAGHGTCVNRRVSERHQQHSCKSGACENGGKFSELKFPVSKTGPILPVLQGADNHFPEFCGQHRHCRGHTCALMHAHLFQRSLSLLNDYGSTNINYFD